MKKNLHDDNKLTKRLTNYALTSGALLSIGAIASGQTQYSDVQNVANQLPRTWLFVRGAGATATNSTPAANIIISANVVIKGFCPNGVFAPGVTVPVSSHQVRNNQSAYIITPDANSATVN